MSDPPRTWRFWTALAAGIVICLPLLLIAAVLIALNTSPGQREAEYLAASLTKGEVKLTGLHGRIPDALRLDALEIRDANGVWLTAQNLTLNWSPVDLIHGDAKIALLAAQHLDIARAPIAAPQTTKQSSTASGLPVKIDADRIAIADLSLGAAIAGAPAHLSATGSAHLATLTQGTADLALTRTDSPGSYALHAAMTDQTITANFTAQEPSKGLASMAARLPDLGALSLDATLDGPWNAAALRLALAAGQLRANAAGTIDTRHNAANLAVTATAPAMTLAPGLSWQSVALDLKLDGPFAKPAATGTLAIAGIAANGATIGRIDGTIAADTNTAAIHLTAQNVALAPPNQALLAGGPLTLQAKISLDDPTRPVTYAFQQPMLNGHGNAVLKPLLAANLTIALPDLAPLARAQNRDVAGNAGLTLKLARDAAEALHIDLDAALDVTGGADAPPAARGNATLGATVTLDGADIILSRLKLDGTTLHAEATGARRNGQVTANYHLAAADLHELTPKLRGNADIAGHLSGTMQGAQQNFAATTDISGTIGTATITPAPLSFTIAATGLPGHPAGHITGTAGLDGSPLALDIEATRDADQTLRVAINRAGWKSLNAAGTLTMKPNAPLPTGTLDLTFANLADLRPIIGQPTAGSLTAKIDLPQTGDGTIKLQARNAGLRGTGLVGQLALDATIAHPTAHPAIAGTLTAANIQAGAINGSLRLAANGPLDALALTLTTTLRQLAGADAAITAAATVNTTAKTLNLARFTTDWHEEHISLAAPANITYAPGIAVDRLRLLATTTGMTAPASIDIAGKLSPALGLTVTAAGITPDLAKPFAPTLNANGALHLDAKLAGTPAAPTGTITLAATRLRLRSGPAAGLPPANLDANITLAGRTAQLRSTLSAGRFTHLAATGTVLLAAAGALDLQTDGAIDLQLLDPILTAQGRRVRGDATLHATITGTTAAPSVTGGLTLDHGEVQDYAQGVHITDIAATIAAEGKTIRIASFAGKAGGGTLGATGSLSLAGAMPVDLHLTADNARPITSDLVTATLDADLAITGEATSNVTAKGKIHVRRADIQIPDNLPQSIAVLNVRRPGDKPPAAGPAGPGLQIPLDITLDAPQQIFVRGRGLDAELGGALHIGGLASAPQTSGSIELRTGTFSLAGTTLTFTSGDISFNGARKIDPALNLIATSSTSEITATLTVGGYASAPKITLSSVPDRPQDEVLAALLFNSSTTSLSPFQLAEIAAALAQISGVTGGGPDALSRLRKGLGLDRLAVGSSTSGTGSSATTTTSVEAGRYIAPGVFLGAKQGVTGSQTQAEVQIDLTRRLKLNTDVGSGTGGNQVGVTYQFQY